MEPLKPFRHILAGVGNQSDSLSAARAVAWQTPEATFDSIPLGGTRSGDALDELLRRAAETEADLISLTDPQLASRAAMLGRASVLLVPTGTRVRFDRILVPIDFSEASAFALRRAATLSREGTICALSVECDEDPWMDWEADHGRVRQHLEEFVAASGIQGAECHVEPLMRDGVQPGAGIAGGDIAATILRFATADTSSLIVMGTRGRTASAALLLGSVAEQVMQRTGIPVLAVKQGSALGFLDALMDRVREPAPILATS